MPQRAAGVRPTGMTRQVLIAGGGIGGLAAALACVRAGWQPRVAEQADAFAEVGAGVQLGPNATRLLQAWGLAPALARVAAFPARLQVRSAASGALLATLRLGADIEQRYGAPYACVHRADLHGLLLAAAREAGVPLKLRARVASVQDGAGPVEVMLDDGMPVQADALVGADGLWSAVRGQVWPGPAPHFTGHVAYRTLLRQPDLPAALRSGDVTVWLGPKAHVVAYPVRGGEALNLVVLVEGAPLAGVPAGRGTGQVKGGVKGSVGGRDVDHLPNPLRDWDHEGVASQLHQAMGAGCAGLMDLVHAAPAWRLWPLNELAPLAGADGMARGSVALLGDAAHPMRPYLAQGAGMAIEDAQVLGNCLALARAPADGGVVDVPAALGRYALLRWERCARVQRRAARNGSVFHAQGPVQWARDLSLRLLGERLLDMPWLYGWRG